MRVIVSGSRSIEDQTTVDNAINSGLGAFDVIGWDWTLVTGGANGVDTAAQRFADRRAIDTEVYLPDWDEHGKAAGPIRNDAMARHGDVLIAIWDGESNGTRDMIEKALDEGLDIYVEVVEP